MGAFVDAPMWCYSTVILSLWKSLNMDVVLSLVVVEGSLGDGYCFFRSLCKFVCFD